MDDHKSILSAASKAKMKDELEKYLGFLRSAHSHFHPRADQSLSLVAAKKASKILFLVLAECRSAEMAPDSPSVRALQAGYDPAVVATSQVHQVLLELQATGKLLQRASSFRLLLANVVRRVLAIVRDAASASRVSSKQLEEIATFTVGENEDRTTVVPTSADDKEDDNLMEMEFEGSPKPVDMQPKTSKSFGGGIGKFALNNSDMNLLAEGMNSTQRQGTFCSRPMPTNPTSIFCDPSSSSAEIGHTPPQRTLTRVESILNVEQEEQERRREYPVDFSMFMDHAQQGITDFTNEFEVMTDNLCTNAANQVYENEVILTIGCTYSMLNFLVQASKEKKFQVIVLEGAPLKGAHILAETLQLQEKEIDVRVLPDSSAFAVMSRVSKVFVSSENVLANGGLLAPIGTHNVCIAAKFFSVPVVVVTMTLKMSPYYPSDARCSSLVKISRTRAEEVPWSTYSFPGDVLPVSRDPCTMMGNTVSVPCSTMEYVPPDLVSLFATNEGKYTVPQVHRLVREQYHADDGHI